MNPVVKIACAVLLVVIVMSAGVGLLVQHRKLDELRRAHADLARANQKLVMDRAELVAANDQLTNQLRMLRDVGRACVAERTDLKASVKDLTASETKIRAERDKLRAERDKLLAERDKLRAERDNLERELNEAMLPAQEMDVSTYPVPDSTDVAVPVTPAPPPDNLTPEERAAHEKEELKDLTDL